MPDNYNCITYALQHMHKICFISLICAIFDRQRISFLVTFSKLIVTRDHTGKLLITQVINKLFKVDKRKCSCRIDVEGKPQAHCLLQITIWIFIWTEIIFGIRTQLSKKMKYNYWKMLKLKYSKREIPRKINNKLAMGNKNKNDIYSAV